MLEKEIIKRNERICKMFLEIAANEPDELVTTAFTRIAYKVKLTPNRVRGILQENGLYTPMKVGNFAKSE